MSHGHADLGESTPQSIFYDRGRFGRLFPTLPPFAADTKLMRDALSELGAKDGPMDAGDDLSDPITLITDPTKSTNNPDNPTITAGFTFLGQFVDHDMTFDPTSSLARRQDPESIRNFRIPLLLHVCCTPRRALLLPETRPDGLLRPNRATRGELGIWGRQLAAPSPLPNELPGDA